MQTTIPTVTKDLYIIKHAFMVETHLELPPLRIGVIYRGDVGLNFPEAVEV